MRVRLIVFPYSIVLADDHIMFRQGIKKIIEETTALEVIGEASDGLELLNLLKSVHPQMVILDISMPSLGGIEAIGEIKMRCPDVKVLILTMHKDKEFLYHAISAGAEGYVLKEDSGTELFSAVDKIRQGGCYISPLLSEDLTDDWVQIVRGTLKPPFEPLTRREREILKLITDGNSNKEIADLLFISVRTVDHHRASIMKKLDMKKTVELVKYAIRKGYTLPTT